MYRDTLSRQSCCPAFTSTSLVAAVQQPNVAGTSSRADGTSCMTRWASISRKPVCHSFEETWQRSRSATQVQPVPRHPARFVYGIGGRPTRMQFRLFVRGQTSKQCALDSDRGGKILWRRTLWGIHLPCSRTSDRKRGRGRGRGPTSKVKILYVYMRWTPLHRHNFVSSLATR